MSPIGPEQLRIYRSYPRLPPETGGMERHISALTAAQRAQGVDVINIFNTGISADPSIRVLAGQNLSRVRPAMLRDLMFYVSARGAVKPITDGRINILHVHGDWSAFLASGLLANVLKPTVRVASMHDKAGGAPALYRSTLKPYAVIFATGYGDAERLSDWIGKKAFHLPSAPLDVFFDSPPSSEIENDIIAVGNLRPIKRNDLLIACALQRPSLRFAIYGDGPERPYLENLIAGHGCRNVRIHGRMPPEKIASALRASRLFINLSDREGTPTAALEAMACGLPVILTPSNDYKWLIREGRNGWVTNGWNIEDILGRIDFCLSNESNRRSMSEANREIASSHRWSAKARFVTDQIIAACGHPLQQRAA